MIGALGKSRKYICERVMKGVRLLRSHQIASSTHLITNYIYVHLPVVKVIARRGESVAETMRHRVSGNLPTGL